MPQDSTVTAFPPSPHIEQEKEKSHKAGVAEGERNERLYSLRSELAAREHSKPKHLILSALGMLAALGCAALFLVPVLRPIAGLLFAGIGAGLTAMFYELRRADWHGREIKKIEQKLLHGTY